jgi:hypothetical protein
MLFLATLALTFSLRGSTRLLPELFMPLLAAGAVFVEELAAGWARGRWVRAGVTVWLMMTASAAILLNLPLLPYDRVLALFEAFRPVSITVKEFTGMAFDVSPFFSARLGYDDLVRNVAEVYDQLPPQDRAIAGIYADGYMAAGAVDELGPAYGLPHAVSGSLTYYLWGPGYSWEVMIIITSKANRVGVFFGKCEAKKTFRPGDDVSPDRSYIFVCRNPYVPTDEIWPSM